MDLYLGCDQSVKHAGYALVPDCNVDVTVCLREAEFYFVSGTQKHAKAAPGAGTLLSVGIDDKEDPEGFDLARLAWWKDYFLKLLSRTEPTHVVLEDYAYGSSDSGVLQIAEVSSQLRVEVAERGIPLRLHGPGRPKMWAAANGAAKPPEFRDAVYRRMRDEWGMGQTIEEWTRWDAGTKKDAPSHDLAVALVLAWMGLVENRVRRGEMAVKDLEPKQIAVFNTVTKYNPLNLLAREWTRIQRAA